MSVVGDDLIHENLIESFRPRLRTYVAVQPVLDLLHFLEPEEKERVRQRARNDGNSAAVDVLVGAVLRKPHPAGWFQAFVDALSNAECRQAADYLRQKLPDPEVEAKNDNCMRMIDILVPSLVGMSTKQVCLLCFSRKLITKDDQDEVSTRLDCIFLCVFGLVFCSVSCQNVRRDVKLCPDHKMADKNAAM